MSLSKRDRDLRKLRQLAKARNALFPGPCSRQEEAAVRGSAEFRALQAEYDALAIKYTYNEYNAFLNINNYRDNSRRNATKRRKEAARRSAKRTAKQKSRAEVQVMLSEDARRGAPGEADLSRAGESESPAGVAIGGERTM